MTYHKHRSVSKRAGLTSKKTTKITLFIGVGVKTTRRGRRLNKLRVVAVPYYDDDIIIAPKPIAVAKS